MKKRSPIAVLLLPFVTFGIYGLYWLVKTKGEMKARGADIPTAWLIIVPIVSIWWIWKYCKGVEHVTNGKLNGLLVFVGFIIIGVIMSPIVQDSFNNLGEAEVQESPAPAAAESEQTTPATTVPVSEAPIEESDSNQATPPTQLVQ